MKIKQDSGIWITVPVLRENTIHHGVKLASVVGFVPAVIPPPAGFLHLYTRLWRQRLPTTLQSPSDDKSTSKQGISLEKSHSLMRVFLQHFELLPEPTVREAQQALLDEITPSIAHLLSLASNHVEKLSRREQGLKAKCELQEGRLSSDEPRKSSRSQSSAALRGRGSGNAAKAMELRRLVQKKERLQYTVERLELQGRQRERQLRKSMAIN